MESLLVKEKIENKIFTLRGQIVMLDADLAELYGVETRVLNQAVKRNKGRFPADFMFQLSQKEWEYCEAQIIGEQLLRSQNVTLKNQRGQHKKYLPYAFTEQGVAMLSGVLKSKKAIEVNIAIMRVFVKTRRLAASYKELAKKIQEIEKKYDKKIKNVFEALNYLIKNSEEDKNKKKEIGFKT